MITKELGKIASVYYGLGGYQDVQLGISFSLSMNGSGVGDFWGFWDTEHTDHCKWTEDDRIRYHGEIAVRISKLLADAKVDRVERLQGIPIEVTLKGHTLDSWRILTEVL